MGELRRQVGAVEQRLLVARYFERFGDQVFHGALRQHGVLVVEQLLDDVRLALVEDGVGDVLAQRLLQGDREAVLLGALLDDFDEVGIGQDAALGQQRPGDVDFVVGEHERQLARRVRQVDEAQRQVLADLHLDVVDERAEHVRHELAFLGRQRFVGIYENLRQFVEEFGPVRRLVLLGQLAEALHLGLPLLIHCVSPDSRKAAPVAAPKTRNVSLLRRS